MDDGQQIQMPAIPDDNIAAPAQYVVSPPDIDKSSIESSQEIANKLLIKRDDGAVDDNGKLKHALSSPLSIKIYILFIIFGMGSSWLLADSMWVQLPYFQQHQPEGFTLANKMTISGIMTLVTVIPLYLIISKYVSYSFRFVVYLMFMIALLSCLLIGFFWYITIENVSIIIFLVSFLVAIVGNLQLIVLIPWITSINNKLSPPIFTGSNIASVLTAIIGLIQQPGSSNPLFTPTIFYILIIFFIIVVSLFSYIYLDYKYIRDIDIKMKKYNTMNNQINTLKYKKSQQNSCLNIIISTFSIPIWWRKVWKFAALNSYIQFVTWVFVRSAVPYAVSHVSNDNNGNTETEQYAIELSLVAVLLGSITAMFISVNKNRYWLYLTGLYTILTLIFLIVAIDNSGLWIFYGSNTFIVTLIVMIRFLDGYMTPLIYENVAKLYPNKSHQMNQWISVISQIVAFCGVWITYVLVQYHAF